MKKNTLDTEVNTSPETAMKGMISEGTWPLGSALTPSPIPRKSKIIFLPFFGHTNRFVFHRISWSWSSSVQQCPLFIFV
uniref:Uncharacterized protein n=1 Tax=Anguilla anguilla TaxID=7936 RepID=A0A0E9WUF2_ANGAN